jgi:hypothetical protein
MAGRESHLVQLTGVPCRHDNSPGRPLFRILKAVNNILELVDTFAAIVSLTIGVCSIEVPPLMPVHRSQIVFSKVIETPRVQELSAAIAIPNVHTIVSKLLIAGRSLNEPQELLKTSLPCHSLSSKQRQAPILKREMHSGPINSLRAAIPTRSHNSFS